MWKNLNNLIFFIEFWSARIFTNRSAYIDCRYSFSSLVVFAWIRSQLLHESYQYNAHNPGFIRFISWGEKLINIKGFCKRINHSAWEKTEPIIFDRKSPFRYIESIPDDVNNPCEILHPCRAFHRSFGLDKLHRQSNVYSLHPGNDLCNFYSTKFRARKRFL